MLIVAMQLHTQVLDNSLSKSNNAMPTKCGIAPMCVERPRTAQNSTLKANIIPQLNFHAQSR